ncbi:hypothetical protein SNE40_010725 [Patella caerulea]|uniref:Uncharacterized protein n=1 Tax=Patella caerulea TaxID=87958 RepID=A0AAN8JYT8_PATCE
MPAEVMTKSNQRQGASFSQLEPKCRRLSSLVSDIGPCQVKTNLLDKTLAARLRKDDLQKSALGIGLGDPEKSLLHLASLNKERNTFISLRGEPRLDSRAREERANLIRERLNRQRDWERLTHPDLHSNAHLPDIDTNSVRSESVVSKLSTKSVPVSFTYGESDDHIGVVKRGGIFQPIQFYTPSRYQHRVAESPFKKPIIDYESIILPPPGCISTEESKSKRKKSGLKVTFKHFNLSDVGSCDTDTRGDDTAGCHRTSAKIPLQRRTYKSEQDSIASVGVAWDISPTGVTKPTSNTIGQISRDLHPVTSGLNKAGTSVKKTKWRVSSCKTFNRPFMPLARYHLNRKKIC